MFPPWSNALMRGALLGGLACAFAVVAGAMVLVRTPWQRGSFEAVDQPVEFDHRHHVQDDGIDCLYCHTTADRAASAGIPSTDKCMGCHSQIWSQSPQLEAVRRSWFSGAPIPWNRVHHVPDFVYFNHAIHVSRGVGCVTCHGRVDEMARVYQVASLTMGWCLDCHRAPEGLLRPPAEVTHLDWEPAAPGESRERVGAEVAATLGVRRLTHCSTCHR